MRKTFHISLSSHNEVMFRDEADLIRGFNSLALATVSQQRISTIWRRQMRQLK